MMFFINFSGNNAWILMKNVMFGWLVSMSDYNSIWIIHMLNLNNGYAVKDGLK